MIFDKICPEIPCQFRNMFPLTAGTVPVVGIFLLVEFILIGRFLTSLCFNVVGNDTVPANNGSDQIFTTFSCSVNFLLGIFHIAAENPEPRPVPPCKGMSKPKFCQWFKIKKKYLISLYIPLNIWKYGTVCLHLKLLILFWYGTVLVNKYYCIKHPTFCGSGFVDPAPLRIGFQIHGCVPTYPLFIVFTLKI